MKKSLLFVFIFSTLLLATNDKVNDSEREKIIAKQIEIEIENEKKHAKEQTFYKGKDYNLKGSEVNKESLDSIEAIEPLEFDMDSVYD